jgi:hypothetical protein
MAPAPISTMEELESQSKVLAGMDPGCAALMLDATETIPSDRYCNPSGFVKANPDLRQHIREIAQSDRLSQQHRPTNGSLGHTQTVAESRRSGTFTGQGSLPDWTPELPLPDGELWLPCDEPTSAVMNPGPSSNDKRLADASVGFDFDMIIGMPEFEGFDDPGDAGDGEKVDFDFPAFMAIMDVQDDE